MSSQGGSDGSTLEGGTFPDSGGGKDSGTDVSVSCGPGQKACGTTCVSVDAVTTGCASASCAPCALPNGIAVCAGGVCALGSCALGYTDCDGVTDNGCEIHTSANPNACGDCNTQCNKTNTTPVCVNGTCTVGQCDKDTADCDKNPANGCEVDLQKDEKHCGSCTNDCQGYSCDNGQCCC